MAELSKDTLPLKTRQRTFQDVSSRIFTPAVALIDSMGEQSGTQTAPLPVAQTGDVLLEILREIKVLNMHLHLITNESFEES